MLSQLGRFSRKVVRKVKRMSGFVESRDMHLIASKTSLQSFMNFFQADEYGHRASIEQGDLGYGWMHYSLIRLLKPKKVLCVGSRHGYIPAILAQACKDNGLGHVYFVDAGFGDESDAHWTGVGYWRTDEGKNVFYHAGLELWITLCVTTTKEFAEAHPEERYDYIYIDGDHSFKGAKLDFDLFWPQLNEYGFIGFHDVSVKGTLPEGEYGVHKVWERIKKKYPTTLEFPFMGSGLGIAQKRPAKG
ncbi:class I SAM-dependent methyltransferase [Patescibacteria group bacterium]|nr:class I SAM-dependent methyltransferase [Patescibacteria group bacterium]